MARAFRNVATAAAKALADKKAEDVLLLHVTGISPLTDYILLATANSRPQLEAMEEEVRKALKAFHITVVRQAKPASDSWRVLDYGGLIVHLMTAEARQFYALDRLYGEAKKVKWQPHARAH